MTAPDAAGFEQHRPRLFGLAYRMLGSAADAADIVQEAHLRYSTSEAPRDAGAYLFTIVARLCLDELKSARARREHYVGAWLPEPILTSDDTPDAIVGRRESVSLAFLVVLERLDPVERAVLVLHDVFDTPHAEIAAMLERTEAGCRQLLKRARARITETTRPRHVVSREDQQRLAERFLATLDRGDVTALAATLAADAIAYADGGGKVATALRPILGAERVARYALALCTKGATRVELREINGGPALLAWTRRGLAHVVGFSFDGERIAQLYVQRNPDKLAGISGSV